jgi:hypothetical protein
LLIILSYTDHKTSKVFTTFNTLFLRFNTKMSTCYFRRIGHASNLDFCLSSLNLQEQDACYVQIGTNDFRYIQKHNGTYQTTYLHLETANNLRRQRRDIRTLPNSLSADETTIRNDFNQFLDKILRINNGVMDNHSLSEMSSWMLIKDSKHTHTSHSDDNSISNSSEDSTYSRNSLHSLRELNAIHSGYTHIHISQSTIESYRKLVTTNATTLQTLLLKQQGKDPNNWELTVKQQLHNLLYPDSFVEYTDSTDSVEGYRFLHSVIEQIENEALESCEKEINQREVPPFKKLFGSRDIENIDVPTEDKKGILNAQKTLHENANRLQQAMQRIESDYTMFFTLDWQQPEATIDKSDAIKLEASKTIIEKATKPTRRKISDSIAAFFMALGVVAAPTDSIASNIEDDKEEISVTYVRDTKNGNTSFSSNADDNDLLERESVFIPKKLFNSSGNIDIDIINALNTDLNHRTQTPAQDPWNRLWERKKKSANAHLQQLIKNPTQTPCPVTPEDKKLINNGALKGGLEVALKAHAKETVTEELTVIDYVDSKRKHALILEKLNVSEKTSLLTSFSFHRTQPTNSNAQNKLKTLIIRAFSKTNTESEQNASIEFSAEEKNFLQGRLRTTLKEQTLDDYINELNQQISSQENTSVAGLT